MIFKKLKQKKELETINEHYKEASALFSYALIQSIEVHSGEFERNPDVFEKVKGSIDKGFSYAEAENHRVAFIHFRAALVEVMNLGQDLVSSDQNIYDAVKRGIRIENEFIIPLFTAYKEKYDF